MPPFSRITGRDGWGDQGKVNTFTPVVVSSTVRLLHADRIRPQRSEVLRGLQHGETIGCVAVVHGHHPLGADCIAHPLSSRRVHGVGAADGDEDTVYFADGRKLLRCQLVAQIA